MKDYTHTTAGKLNTPVCRLGLSASYRPSKPVIYKAIDAGINVFFLYGFDTQMIAVLRDVLRRERERFIVATGPYNLVWGHTSIRKTLEKRLRQLNTDYIDAFLLLGVLKEKQFDERVRDEMLALKSEGKARGIGLSTHNRPLAGKLAADGAIDVLMMRYNAAHRGAEEDIFPHLSAHNPMVISYTATTWRKLLKRPSNWPKDGRVPTPSMAYRFVLSRPEVHVCLNAPSNEAQLLENLSALRDGPLDDDETQFMRQFGDAVHAKNKKRW